MSKLTEIREAKGFSKAHLAKIANMSGTAITLLEQGKRFFSKESLRKLAEALECSQEELLGDDLKEIRGGRGGSIRGTNHQISKTDKNMHESSQALNPVLFRYTLEILDELTKGKNLSSDQKIELATGIYSKVEEYERAEGVDKSKLLSQAKISLMIDEGLVNFLSKKQHDEIQNLQIANEPNAKEENCSDDGVGTPRIIAK